MSQPQTSSVELDELSSRAGELESPLELPPTDPPAPPCNLAMVINATQQLEFSAESIRTFVVAGTKQWSALSHSLRNAALAYQQVDEDAAQAVNAGSDSVSPATLTAMGGPPHDATLSAAPVRNPSLTASTSVPETMYADLKERALDIEQGDQGASLVTFADAWETMQQTLQHATYRFRPFQYWTGPATDAVQANFQQQTTWLSQMAELCGTLVTQARTLVSAHHWAAHEHIYVNHHKFGYADIVEQEKRVIKYGEMANLMYSLWQEKSDDVLAQYPNKAGLPLVPANPPFPPTAYQIDPPPKPEPATPGSPPESAPGVLTPPNAEQALDPGLAGLSSFPSVPSMPFGSPAMPAQDALKDMHAAPTPPKPLAVKPASLGGGGVPSMPLQSAPDAVDALPRPPERASFGLGASEPGARGATGGATGMAPLAPPLAGQHQGPGSKAKRPQPEGESLYTEDRPWTEGLIASPKHKAAPERQDAK